MVHSNMKNYINSLRENSPQLLHRWSITLLRFARLSKQIIKKYWGNRNQQGYYIHMWWLFPEESVLGENIFRNWNYHYLCQTNVIFASNLGKQNEEVASKSNKPGILKKCTRGFLDFLVKSCQSSRSCQARNQNHALQGSTSTTLGSRFLEPVHIQCVLRAIACQLQAPPHLQRHLLASPGPYHPPNLPAIIMIRQTLFQQTKAVWLLPFAPLEPFLSYWWHSFHSIPLPPLLPLHSSNTFFEKKKSSSDADCNLGTLY